MRISFDFNLALFQGTHYQEYACQKELNSGLLIVVVVFSILIFMTPPPPLFHSMVNPYLSAIPSHYYVRGD